MESVKSVRVCDEYQLEIEFDNNEIRLFDARPYLDMGDFRQLKDPARFQGYPRLIQIPIAAHSYAQIERYVSCCVSLWRGLAGRWGLKFLHADEQSVGHMGGKPGCTSVSEGNCATLLAAGP